MFEWLVVSTMCFPYVIHPGFGGAIEPDVCVQTVSISTFQPTPKEGETVYKVMPDGHVAIPRKVWEKTFRLAYWNHSANTYNDFQKLLDDIEGLEKKSFNPQTPEFTRKVINEEITRLRTKIQENALDRKVGDKTFEELLDESEKVADKQSAYYPHIHRWRDGQEIVTWTEKCYCGKRRRKLESWKWVEE